MSTDHLLAQLARVADGIGRTFPGCEVVVHDLRDPRHTVHHLVNPASGRSVGDPATELGLARVTDPGVPDVIANYANSFPDGRAVKSTSIGLRDEAGAFVAALCLNLDVSALAPAAAQLAALAAVETSGVTETLASAPHPGPVERLTELAHEAGTAPDALSPAQRRPLLARLAAEGHLRTRGAVPALAQAMGVSRSTVYNDLRTP